MYRILIEIEMLIISAVLEVRTIFRIWETSASFHLRPFHGLVEELTQLHRVGKIGRLVEVLMIDFLAARNPFRTRFEVVFRVFYNVTDAA